MTTAVLEFPPVTEFAIDPIEEMRMRTWARQNYMPLKERTEEMHPIILDEMTRRDQEQQDA